MATVVIFSNILHFYSSYGKYVRKDLDLTHTRTLAVSDVIRRYTPKDSGLVVFGLKSEDGPASPIISWSSEIAYYSQRKSLTVKKGAERYVTDPRSFLGGKELGAIVFCANKDEPRYKSMIARFSSEPALFPVHDCLIYLPGVRSVTLQNGEEILPVDSSH
jgi:hypothetical protein